MRVPRAWLRELVDVDVPTEELADRLSMTGSAVDKIERFAPGVSGVVVGEVLEVSDVPESDKLCVAQLDVGNGRVQVLAGAKNFAKGDRVPVALPGARVTTLDQPVGARKMMGLTSQGMLCSALEIGLSDDHAGIVVLENEVPVGTDVASLLGLDDDVLEFEIYPNRPDQMSVTGIAREVALLYNAPLRMPDPSVEEAGGKIADVTSVTIEDLVGCPRYLARVIEEVSFAPSPLQVQARLAACGFRPVGNLVDATNYVLLLTGQPLHAFDLDKLSEQRIVVRRAQSGERMVTIDDEDRRLEPEDLVIADANRAQAIAGVMGGAHSEVGGETRRVLLESAYFDPISIARTARRHHMRTEASARFERGSDPEAVVRAAAIAAELMRKWASGVVAKGVVDAGEPPARPKLFLRPERIETVLGIKVDAAERERVLRGIGCEVKARKDGLEAVPPSWRPDLVREIDLIEEIARLHGYDKIPTEHKSGVRGSRTRKQVLRERVREALIGAGIFEATLPTFVAAEDLERVGHDGPVVRVTNPITSDQQQLRPSLFPGLLRAAQHNMAHGVAEVRLFEIGKIFRGWPDDADLPDESEHVAVLLAGGAVDALDLKGVLEMVIEEIGVSGHELGPPDGALFHPGRAATFVVDRSAVGRFGEVRPSVARAFDLEGPVVIGGLALEALFDLAPTTRTLRPLPTQPPVLRDIALALSDEVPAATVEATIRAAAGEFLESVVLFDVYIGGQLPAGKRSLAYTLTFRAPDRTLTAAEADTARQAVVDACRDALGAEIR